MSAGPRRCVLVTGANGFVGRALAPALAAQGWLVRAAGRVAAQVPAAPGIEPVAMPDLAGNPDWEPLIAGATHVVHLAGIAHSRAAIAEAVYHRVNAEAAGGLARAAARASVRRMVFVSSVRAQSGPAVAGALTESDPPQPTDAYGLSKLAGEALVRAELQGAATILRPVLVLGPGVKGNLASLRRLAHRPVPLPFGSLHNRRSLVGLNNLVSAIAFGLESPAAGGRTFLVADPEPLSVAELVAAMRTAIGRRPGLIPVPPRLLTLALKLTGQGGLAASLLGDLIADGSAIAAAGWRPVSTTRAEIARLMM